MHNDPYALVPALIVITLSCFCTYINHPYMRIFSVILFLILSIFFPYYLLYLPIVMYDILYTKQYKYIYISILPLALHYNILTNKNIIFILLFLGGAILLSRKTNQIHYLLKEYRSYRDTTKEYELLLKQKNKSLLENQDYEIRVAILNERNRISKEIHDNIGHILTRALLQIGALLTISNDDSMKSNLSQLKNSISEGMDSIRNSIHNMHDESIDLYTTLNSLIKEFTFCPIYMNYHIQSSLPLKLKFCFIAILKEALSNIIKHSNATEVSISCIEHPIMYQLIIWDNGTTSHKISLKDFTDRNEQGKGMGLHSIIDRVQGFQGNIYITDNSGFKIFITIPKTT